MPVAADGETVAVKVTNCPKADGLRLDVRVVVVLVLPAVFTVCVMAGDVLPLQLLSPPYVAVIGWLPTMRVEVDKVALPPLNVPLPSVVAPSKNVTVPVAVDGETVAVKVTICPEVDGLRPDVVVVVVAALFTVCERAAEVLPL